jgi:protein SCO1/2
VRAAALLLVWLACGVAFAHKDHEAQHGWERLEADEPAPAFRLVSQDGRRVSLEDLRGKPLVVTFLYTSCTDVCPVLLHTLTLAERQLAPRERGTVRFIAITVDPVRDTPVRLRGYMKERGLDPTRWLLLTGSLEEAARAANDYGVVVRPAPRGDFVHNSVFVVIDAEGRERAEFHGLATPPEAIAAELRLLLKERRK